MSLVRKLVVPNDLAKKIDDFYKIVIDHKTQHKDDPEYYSKLTKPLNELRTRQTGLMKDVDYASEVADRCAKFELYKEELDSADNILDQRITSHVLNQLIKDLKDEVDLFDHAANLPSDKAQLIHELCQSLIIELSDLKEDVIFFTIQTLIDRLQELNKIVHENHKDNENKFETHRVKFLDIYRTQPKESKEPAITYSNSLSIITALKNDITFFKKASSADTNEHSLCKLIIDELDAVSEHATSFKK